MAPESLIYRLLTDLDREIRTNNDLDSLIATLQRGIEECSDLIEDGNAADRVQHRCFTIIVRKLMEWRLIRPELRWGESVPTREDLDDCVEELEILAPGLEIWAGYPEVLATLRRLCLRRESAPSDEQRRNRDLQASRVRELERDPPLCPNGHRMELRKDRQERWFWGCTEFTNPDSHERCYMTRPATQEERVYLDLERDEPLTRGGRPPGSRLPPSPLEDETSDSEAVESTDTHHASSPERSSRVERVKLDLKAWRLERSRAAGFPAYIILQDRTLNHIAEVLPQTLGALERIPGIGPVRLRRYGEEILEIVRSQS
jgi:hypothetical protein